MTSSGWILREQHKVYREQERTYKNGRNNKKLKFCGFSQQVFLLKTLKKLNLFVIFRLQLVGAVPASTALNVEGGGSDLAEDWNEDLEKMDQVNKIFILLL